MVTIYICIRYIWNVNEISIRYQWKISLYPPLIKCSRREHPRTKWTFPASKFIELNGRSSGKLCLITGGYMFIMFHPYVVVSTTKMVIVWYVYHGKQLGYTWIYCFFPCCQGTRKETCCSRYIKFSGVVLNPAWTSARLAPPIKFKHHAMWNRWKANKSTKKMTWKNGETKWENLSGK